MASSTRRGVRAPPGMTALIAFFGTVSATGISMTPGPGAWVYPGSEYRRKDPNPFVTRAVTDARYELVHLMRGCLCRLETWSRVMPATYGLCKSTEALEQFRAEQAPWNGP